MLKAGRRGQSEAAVIFSARAAAAPAEPRRQRAGDLSLVEVLAHQRAAQGEKQASCVPLTGRVRSAKSTGMRGIPVLLAAACR